MSEENNLSPHVKYWLSPDSKHDCYFIVGPASGPTKKIGSFKAFLIGYSEVFRAMLQDNELEQGDISIIDIQPDTFSYFIKCLYMNCENIKKDKPSFGLCLELLYVAEKYLVMYVKETLISNLKTYLTADEIEVDDIFIGLTSPAFLSEKSLEILFAKIVESKVDKMFSSPLFLNISSESFLWILELNNLKTDEITIWEHLLKWAKHNTDSSDANVLRQFMLKHLKLIRFCSMMPKDFCNKVVITDILTHTEVNEICKSFGEGKSPSMEFICNNKDLRHNSDKESVFSYAVNNIEDLEKMSNSPKFTLRGLEWKILFGKRGESFSFFLVCEGRDPKSAINHSVKGKLILFNHSKSNLSRSITMIYNKVEDWGFNDFIPWSEMINPSNNFVLNNSIILLVQIL